MTEILTESFCERCGTRYTFETAAPRQGPGGRVRVLGKGLRNFVLSDGTTISEALADARSEEGLAATAHQLDAFHRTFSFCLGCRQYTCADCWNGPEGRCLSCAPTAEPVAVPGPPAAPIGLTDLETIASGATPPVGGPAVSTAPDVPSRRAPDVATHVPPSAPVEAHGGEDAALLALQTRLVLGRFRPGQSLDAEIEAYEAKLAEAAGGVPPAAAVPAVEAMAEPEPEPEPEPGAELEAASEPAPEIEPPVAATPADPVPEVAPAARIDVVAQPTWQIVAPEIAPGPLPPPEPANDPHPSITAPHPSISAATSARRLVEAVPGTPPGAAALWAASSREVVSTAAATGSVPQACVSCGLALSITARFCRRCGTAQG
jgi:hypothetical protein